MAEAQAYQKDFVVTWDRIQEDTKALCVKFQDKAFKGIVAITRGGLAPALIVSQELDIKHIETLCISSYDHQEQKKAEIIKQPDLPGGGLGWLIIDDLVDTGKTFEIARELYPNATLACVYGKPAGIPKVDCFQAEIAQDTWIHFPWEETAPA